MPRLKPFYQVLPDSWCLVADASGTRRDRRELVRQWLIKELIGRYDYPRSWLGKRLVAVEAEAEYGCPSGFLGFCLLTQKGDPFLWVSVAEPGKAGDAESRLREVLRRAQYARMGISSDGTTEGTRFLRRRSDNEECDFLVDLEPYASSEFAGGPRPCVAPPARSGNADPKGRLLEPISEQVENVFFEAHSHIRDIDGMHADESLDELCKVLYAKMYDEEMTHGKEPYTLQRWLYGCAEEFAATIRRVYDEANEYDVRVFSLKIPGYDRSRGVFNAPIRLSSAALVRVVETLQDYSLMKAHVDVKGRAFQRVLGPSVRAGMGQYFTPLEVIRFMVEVISPAISELILDPFAGSAHFLTASLDLVRSAATRDDTKRLDEFAFNKLHGIEKSDRMVRVAMTDMRLHGDGHSNVRCADALLAFSNYPDLRPDSFDVVLTNPPFGSLLGQEAIARLGKFALAEGRSSVPLEVLGLERCVQFIRPGGRLGIVLPDGILVNRGTHGVRAWLEGEVKLRAIVSLPIETFSPYGASIKTSILFARKWKRGESRGADYPVCLVRIDDIGYDATGRIHHSSELKDGAQHISAFLEKEGW
jgi:type I restriction enzyme M protein